MVEDIATGRPEATDEMLRASETHVAPEAPAAHPNPLPLTAALAAAAALAACGGGGGGGGGGANFAGMGGVQAGSLSALANTPTGRTYIYTQAKTDDEAARFLLQSQFSASEAEIAAVRAKGYLPWLGEQVDRPPTQTGWDWIASKPYNTVYTDDMIWNQLMIAPDGMRKRMALAFTEIFVVSANDISSNWTDHMMAQYWDMLVAGVTGNFRKLLEDVTLNPAMGYYLNTRGNQKENAQGRQPDENYAREVMQLMTIGLYQLNADGSVKTGADGTPLDSYSQDDVTNLARVFTGYDLDIAASERNAFTPPGASYTVESNAWTRRPMALTASRHSMLEARFLGATVPANTEGKAALKIALDTLFNHPNVGPLHQQAADPAPGDKQSEHGLREARGGRVRRQRCRRARRHEERLRCRAARQRGAHPRVSRTRTSAACASRCCASCNGPNLRHRLHAGHLEDRQSPPAPTTSWARVRCVRPRSSISSGPATCRPRPRSPAPSWWRPSSRWSTRPAWAAT